MPTLGENAVQALVLPEQSAADVRFAANPKHRKIYVITHAIAAGFLSITATLQVMSHYVTFLCL